jgi:hypothetical protein
MRRRGSAVSWRKPRSRVVSRTGARRHRQGRPDLVVEELCGWTKDRRSISIVGRDVWLDFARRRDRTAMRAARRSQRPDRSSRGHNPVRTTGNSRRALHPIPRSRSSRGCDGSADKSEAAHVLPRWVEWPRMSIPGSEPQALLRATTMSPARQEDQLTDRVDHRRQYRPLPSRRSWPESTRWSNTRRQIVGCTSKRRAASSDCSASPGIWV